MPRRGPDRLLIAADLHVEVEQDGQPPLRIDVTGESSTLRVTLNDLPGLGIPARRTPVVDDAVRRVVDSGVTVVVEGPRGRLVSVGTRVRTPWWQRPFVSSHLRIHDVRGLLGWLRKPARSEVAALASVNSVLPTLFAPPSTVFPLAPTLGARPRITTTHDPAGGGRPRLYFSPDSTAGATLRVFYLSPRTVVGDTPEADLRLDGVAARQAVIARDDRDEYYLLPDPGGLPIKVHGRVITGPQLLRTGTLIEIADWRMAYAREEYADHGRPYGGRLGGEIGHQREQAPPRSPDGHPA